MVFDKKRIRELLKSEEMLDRLEALGVDNWGSYGEIYGDEHFEETLEEAELFIDRMEIEFGGNDED